MRCPYCNDDGAYFVGTSGAEIDHFMRRFLWDAHRLRQALVRAGSTSLHDIASVIINEAEELAGLIRDWRKH